MKQFPAPGCPMIVENTGFELRTADGLNLSGQAWMPPSRRAVVALVHGIAEHCGRYGFLAERAGARGLALVSADLRGHGMPSAGDERTNLFSHMN